MSTDSGVAGTFHSNCDNKGPTLTVVRSSSGHLFGAVAANSWSSSAGSLASAGSFLFCLDCAGERHTPRQLVITTADPGSAMYGSSGYGPTFGSAHDLHIANHPGLAASSYANLGHKFECPTHSGSSGSSSGGFTTVETF